MSVVAVCALAFVLIFGLALQAFAGWGVFKGLQLRSQQRSKSVGVRKIAEKANSADKDQKDQKDQRARP